MTLNLLRVTYVVSAPVQIVNMIKLVIILSFLIDNFGRCQSQIMQMRQVVLTLDRRVSCTDKMIVDRLQRYLLIPQYTTLLFLGSINEMT